MDKESLHSKGEEKKKEPVQVKLKWGATDELETVYVNNMTINYTGNEYYVIFGELCMPAVLDVSDLPKEITITPKVRLAISPVAMADIARVISGYVQKDKGE